MVRTSWDIYDELIEGIDPAITMRDAIVGSQWTMVDTGAAQGVALTVRGHGRDYERPFPLAGTSLRDVAARVKSWNLTEASLGMAAINAFYNDPARIKALGVLPGADTDPKEEEAFVTLSDRARGKKVACIGHFPNVERELAGICDLSIIERNQGSGDFPDSAAEFILPDQDMVFITGMTFTNKTLPRLLDIVPPSTELTLVGPSVPASDTLFAHGADTLSSFTATRPEALIANVKEGKKTLFSAGTMFSYERPDGVPSKHARA